MNKLLLFCLITLAVSADTELETFRNEVLAKHNNYRAQHQVDNLVRNAEIEQIAQTYSEYLAEQGTLTHSQNYYNGSRLGENLYMSFGYGGYNSGCVDTWYNEVSNYNFNSPGYTSGAGHFTQVVWKNSRQLGCGGKCSSNSCYITCDYYPAGNVLNHFAENVLPKVGTTTTSDDNTSNGEDTSSSNEELETFRSEALTRHNYYRSLHQVGNLVRDTQLEQIAQTNSEYMSENSMFNFSKEKYNGGYIGENLFMYVGSFDGVKVTDMWYQGVSKYDFDDPKYVSGAGQFTQLVWKKTQKMGCGYKCQGTKCYGSCAYYPSGNYLNQFASNVFPQK